MEKAKQYIGLAARAGRVVAGAQAVEMAVRNHKAYLVILDCSSSANTKKKWEDLCRSNGIKLCHMQDPCRMAGKPGRMCIAVSDAGLAKQIEKQMQIQTEQDSGGRG